VYIIYHTVTLGKARVRVRVVGETWRVVAVVVGRVGLGGLEAERHVAGKREEIAALLREAGHIPEERA
jgi:hypothetical protein